MILILFYLFDLYFIFYWTVLSLTSKRKNNYTFSTVLNLFQVL